MAPATHDDPAMGFSHWREFFAPNGNSFRGGRRDAVTKGFKNLKRIDWGKKAGSKLKMGCDFENLTAQECCLAPVLLEGSLA